jgi:hypothetical protein
LAVLSEKLEVNIGAGYILRAVLSGVPSASGGTTMPQAVTLAEREWARVLARRVANQLPEAIRQVPDVQLTAAQIEELRRVFENTLITNMGCEVPPS